MRKLVTETETIELAEEATQVMGKIVVQKAEESITADDGSFVGIYLPSEPDKLLHKANPVVGCRVVLELGEKKYVSAPVTNTSGWDEESYRRQFGG